MPKGIKQTKIDRQNVALAEARSEFFSGVTESEAAEVFKLLALLSTFPGATPPAPLSGAQVIWTSTIRVGDTVERQVFDVQVRYRGLLFKRLTDGGRVIQLSDSTFMNFDNWEREDERLRQQVSNRLEREAKGSNRNVVVAANN